MATEMTQEQINATLFDEVATLRAENERLRNLLEVSEAVNQAKTVCIVDIKQALNRLSGLKQALNRLSGLNEKTQKYE